MILLIIHWKKFCLGPLQPTLDIAALAKQSLPLSVEKIWDARILLSNEIIRGGGDYYLPEANAQLFDKLGDIGVNPLFFDEYSYNLAPKKFEPQLVDSDIFMRISGTEARKKILNGERLPLWYMRDVVQDVIVNSNKMGNIFC